MSTVLMDEREVGLQELQVSQQVDPHKVHTKLLKSQKQNSHGGLQVGPVHKHLELSLGQVDFLNCRLGTLQNTSV